MCVCERAIKVKWFNFNTGGKYSNQRLKMDVGGPSVRLVSIYHTTLRQIPEEHNINH
jgi:hypothetical protein